MVLMDLGSGEYFGLDRIAAEVWRELALGKEVGEIVEGLAASYEADRELLLPDVGAFVEECLRVRILSPAPPDLQEEGLI